MAKIFNSGIFIRITALWAFSEAFLGGILHGFKFPFAGLALALIASLCMSLLAVHEKKGAILKATLAVIAVKFLLSPHTPPTAYLAVFIEGLAGELFFISKKQLKLSAFFLTLFCLMYSAFQHLIMLTLVFGKGFWSAIDIFFNGITKNFVKQPQQYSLIIVVVYLLCYLIAGIIGGLLNKKIISSNSNNGQLIASARHLLVTETVVQPKKKKGFLKYTVPFLLLIILAASYTPAFEQSLLKNKITTVLTRGILFIIVWAFAIAPLLKYAVGRFANKYKYKQNSHVQQVIALLPDVKNIVAISWKLAKGKNFVSRFGSFLNNTVTLIVNGT
jgi:hypothetical protein